ncbi:Coiled-coil domain-containing protein 51 [Eufriesea mexicana]|uniref:Coiled-coil domain-containing protein 51 n=1 Tax=Eufriesea mexicana TaxID=516756 RepID=A0A310SII4_9HYME|nr:PREDICTED: uncharacterized protein LOC108552187 [Eufriesea mexicana]OAD53889.1 Coiled-coil domain-containing protein 51 [Eufriesea mexicana]
MGNKFRSLITVLSSKINKHQLLNDTTTKINNVSEKAQEKLNDIQNTVATKYNIFVKRVNDDITLFQNSSIPQIQPSPLPKKVVKWWQWYQQLTGFDIVELTKQQVVNAQNKLFECQDKRRTMNRELILINDKLKEIYSELIQTKRDDPKYVQLTIVENKNLQNQTKIVTQLNLLEKEENCYFTLLATSIKEYHDNQILYNQRQKYISLIASAITAIVLLICSMIYNNSRIKEIKNVVFETQQRNENIFQDNINSLQMNINRYLSNIVSDIRNRVSIR